MSSYFALVTPLNGFDGQPALPGQLPTYPPHPWFPGRLPGGFPGADNTLPGGPPAHPWLPGYGGAPGIDNSLPGGPARPWFGGLPGQGGGTLPAPPGYISIQPLPPTPSPDGTFWALSAYGWVQVPDAYKPPPDTKPPPTGTPT